ncbi:hypothetical protein B7495_06465 [Cryobacterium sp. LW097]|uniref:hypothetical protein n=1 Tax=Cryobacterium sp. LW097 TaxID=1978566 RepID=UPI000B4CFD27|nr:hypothetical protein [Cryobacterium sp. LW097]ASD21782.1 hypothetical protein B7495_06465 [Cryobacterium sp. LW097]
MSRPAPISWLLRHPVANAQSRESAALLVGAAVFLVGALASAITFWGDDVPIAGPGSVGQFVALASAAAAAVIFVTTRAVMHASRAAGTLLDPGPPGHGGQLRWYDIGALALAHAVISLLAWLAVAGLLSRSFIGAVVFPASATLLAAVAIAVTAYSVFLSAVGLTPILMSIILAVFVVVGTFASMLSASDPLWWQENLSTLGISDDISALAFNLTVLIAGIIVTTLAHYATAAIPAATPEEVRGRALVRGALVLIGVLLAGVGIFPLDQNMAAHNVSATGMIVVFITVVVRLRSWIPTMSRVFLLLGYLYVGVLIVLAVWFLTGYYTLTAVELVAFVMIFSWLIVFLRQTGAMLLAENRNRGESAILHG